MPGNLAPGQPARLQWGVIADERQRDALKVAAENIPGVKAVEDHLVWVEPITGMIIEPQDQAVKHSRRAAGECVLAAHAHQL
jgi:hypothetical protein